MSKNKIKDVLIRAGKTFAQAFISSISIDSFVGITDSGTAKKILLAALIGSVAAGISAIWNMGVDFVVNIIDKWMPSAEEITETIEMTESEGENDE